MAAVAGKILGGLTLVVTLFVTQDTTPARPTYAIATPTAIQFLDKDARLLHEHPTTATAVQLNSAGTHVAWVTPDNKLTVMSTRTGATPRVVTTAPTKWRWAPVGSSLAYVAKNKLYTYRASTPSEAAIQVAEGVQCLAWSPDGTRLIAGITDSRGGALVVLSTEGGRARRILEGRYAQSVDWAPDGRRIAFLEKPLAGKDARILSFTVGSTSLKVLSMQATGELTWSPDARRILVPSPARCSYVELAAPGSHTIATKFEGGAQWGGSRVVVGRVGTEIVRVSLVDGRTRVIAKLPTDAAIRAAAMIPQIEITQDMLKLDNPFSRAPRPAANSITLHGIVDDFDPMTESATILVDSITDARGKETTFGRPLRQAIAFSPSTQRRGDDNVPFQILDVRQDEVVMVSCQSTKLDDARSLPTDWIIFGRDREDGSFEPNGSFPAFGNPSIESDRVTRAKYVLPIVHPVIGKTSTEDWFLKPRTGHRHKGQDIMSVGRKKMLPMVAVFDGTVTIGRGRGTAGNTISVTNRAGWVANYYHVNNDMPNTNDGRGGDRYAFAPGISSGMQVRQGQFLGYLGNSGNAESTGPHCHFELYYRPKGVHINAYPSLVKAKKLSAPIYFDPAPNLVPGAGELRVDGIVNSCDVGSATLSFEQVATREAVGGARVTTFPTSDSTRIGAQTVVKLRRNMTTSLRLADIKPGHDVSLLLPHAKRSEPKVVAVDTR